MMKRSCIRYKKVALKKAKILIFRPRTLWRHVYTYMGTSSHIGRSVSAFNRKEV